MSRVIQYRVKEEVKVRKQETVEERIQCFRCWGVGHYKWEYPNIKVEKERRRSEKVVHCYGSPKQEKVSCAFEHLVQNLKVYNGVEI